MGVYIFLAVLAALVIFVGILLIRTALAAKKAEPIGEKPVYTTEREDTENGERLMSHHDVVAATGEWSHAKFGEIEDGKLWGRGTVDTKTPLFAEMTAAPIHIVCILMQNTGICIA